MCIMVEGLRRGSGFFFIFGKEFFYFWLGRMTGFCVSFFYFLLVFRNFFSVICFQSVSFSSYCTSRVFGFIEKSSNFLVRFVFRLFLLFVLNFFLVFLIFYRYYTMFRFQLFFRYEILLMVFIRLRIFFFYFWFRKFQGLVLFSFVLGSLLLVRIYFVFAFLSVFLGRSRLGLLFFGSSIWRVECQQVVLLVVAQGLCWQGTEYVCGIDQKQLYVFVVFIF